MMTADRTIQAEKWVSRALDFGELSNPSGAQKDLFPIDLVEKHGILKEWASIVQANMKRLSILLKSWTSSWKFRMYRQRHKGHEKVPTN